MKILGVVGGIGSGKSFVTRILERNHGAVAIHADRIAHELLAESAVVRELVGRFGDEIQDEAGQVLRSRLASLVFGDDPAHAENLKFLECVLHPRVRVEIRRRIDAARAEGAKLIVLDVPLLFESKWDEVCDGVLFVDASDEARFSRTASRGWSEASHRLRESRQLPIAEKKKRSRWRVSNEGDAGSTERQASDLIDELMES